MESITLKAMAKINLGLDVIRRREDGYHEVRMIMQTVQNVTDGHSFICCNNNHFSFNDSTCN